MSIEPQNWSSSSGQRRMSSCGSQIFLSSPQIILTSILHLFWPLTANDSAPSIIPSKLYFTHEGKLHICCLQDILNIKEALTWKYLAVWKHPEWHGICWLVWSAWWCYCLTFNVCGLSFLQVIIQQTVCKMHSQYRGPSHKTRTQVPWTPSPCPPLMLMYID